MINKYQILIWLIMLQTKARTKSIGFYNEVGTNEEMIFFCKEDFRFKQSGND